MIVSKLKRLLRAFANTQIKSDHIESGNCNAETNASSDIIRDPALANYEPILTVKHVTTFHKAKRMLAARRLIPDDLLGIEGRKNRPVLIFEPVTSMKHQSSKGNVVFGFRTLNGAHGIWDCSGQDEKNKVWDAFGKLISPDKDLRYYLIEKSTSSTVLLITREDISGLDAYNPDSSSSFGPWKTSWNPTTRDYDHYIKGSNHQVLFALDESALEASAEHGKFFHEGIFVSYNECVHQDPNIPNNLDNHVTTGPLRLFLSASCFRWRGGVHCVTSGDFDPERAIQTYEAYHARMSRAVLINTNECSENVILEQNFAEEIQQLLLCFRVWKYAAAKAMCSSLTVKPKIRKHFSNLCEEMVKTENPAPLRSALQAFVLFLASNCLDVKSTMKENDSEELCDFNELYMFVLSFLPSKSHQIFRDCIVNRIIRAIDEVY